MECIHTVNELSGYFIKNVNDDGIHTEMTRNSATEALATLLSNIIRTTDLLPAGWNK